MANFRPLHFTLGVLLYGCTGHLSAASIPALWEEPSSFFPGTYFDHKAQWYLKNKDYRAALEMFQLSGFWGNKLAQYNAAVMLFNGIGVPVDKVQGVAWFRIAAETHGDLVDNALKAASDELTDPQRAEADALWQTLDAKYGNKVTLDRAIARYEADLYTSTGHGHWKGNLQVYEMSGGGASVPGEVFDKRRDAQFAAFIGQLTGTVTVGKITALAVPDEVRTHASTSRIDGGEGLPRP